jgi:hypothetical protein
VDIDCSEVDIEGPVAAVVTTLLIDCSQVDPDGRVAAVSPLIHLRTPARQTARRMSASRYSGS